MHKTNEEHENRDSRYGKKRVQVRKRVTAGGDPSICRLTVKGAAGGNCDEESIADLLDTGIKGREVALIWQGRVVCRAQLLRYGVWVPAGWH
jgi:hypothetical protein